MCCLFLGPVTYNVKNFLEKNADKLYSNQVRRSPQTQYLCSTAHRDFRCSRTTISQHTTHERAHVSAPTLSHMYIIVTTRSHSRLNSFWVNLETMQRVHPTLAPLPSGLARPEKWQLDHQKLFRRVSEQMVASTTTITWFHRSRITPVAIYFSEMKYASAINNSSLVCAQRTEGGSDFRRKIPEAITSAGRCNHAHISSVHPVSEWVC